MQGGCESEEESGAGKLRGKKLGDFESGNLLLRAPSQTLYLSIANPVTAWLVLLTDAKTRVPIYRLGEKGKGETKVIWTHRPVAHRMQIESTFARNEKSIGEVRPEQ